LSKALQGFRPAPEVVWRAFQLNPSMPPGGTPRAAYRAAKFGVRSRELEERVSEAGRAEGIEFAFDRIQKVPNTFDPHRVLRRALREGRQDEVHEALFRAYFQEGRDIGDPKVLADVSGIALSADEEAEDVRRDEAEGRALGISGVPMFVIDRAFGVSGAQPPEVLRQAIREAVGAD
jgi:predicted DsbA family dithiol-disulfide isomerase